MKQLPSKYKFRKCHKANFSYMKLLEKKNFFLSLGHFGLQSLAAGKLNFKQIEACRRTIRRGLKKKGFILIKSFTGTPVTKKPLASRMGKGKGSISFWISLVKKGQILFEIRGVKKFKAMWVLSKCKYQLPFKTKIVKIFY